MDSNYQVDGIPEVDALFEALGDKLGGQTLTRILRKNAARMVRVAKQNSSHADVTGGTTRSIGLINGRGDNRYRLIYLGPRRSKGGAHAHLLEFGTGPRMRANGGSTGSMAAQPFMRPAFDATVAEVREGIRLDLAELIRSGYRTVTF